MHVCMSFHTHTAIPFIIYSKYVHVYARVFAQQMPVSAPRDKTKGRPLGQKIPEKRQQAIKKIKDMWHGGLEREAMIGGMEG